VVDGVGPFQKVPNDLKGWLGREEGRVERLPRFTAVLSEKLRGYKRKKDINA